MPDKKCPHCGLWNHDSALRCDCGYNFEKGAVDESYDKKPRLITGELLGFFYVIFALLLLVWPFFSLGGAFAYIAHGSTTFLQIAVWSVWTYPATYLIALIGSIVLYRKNHPKASLLFAILPIINIIVSWAFLAIPIHFQK